MRNQGPGIFQVGNLWWLLAIIDNLGPDVLNLKLTKVISYVKSFRLKKSPVTMKQSYLIGIIEEVGNSLLCEHHVFNQLRCISIRG